MSTAEKTFKDLPIIRNFFRQQSVKTFVNPKNGKTTFALKGNRSFNYELNIDRLNLAISRAEDTENPSRVELYELYNSLRDLHLKSQMRTSIIKVVSEAWFMVDKNNKPNDEQTKLLQKKWFQDLCEHYLSTEFWGHSLIYFNMDQETLEMSEAKLFPRKHVLPEKSSIIPDLGSEDKMFSYAELKQLKDLFIEVKDTEPLGMLKDLARYSILKNFAFNDWARSSEKWGDPLIVLRSASTNDAEDDAKEEFLKNFGNNGYAIVDEEDKIELLERKTGGNSHNIFKDLISLNNDENSKGVNGQTATSDEKSYVGSSEVQERILNAYSISRLRDLMFFMNEIVIPYLINYNGGVNAYQGLKELKWIPKSLMEEEDEAAKPDDKKKKDKKDQDLLENSIKETIENALKNPFI